MMLSKLLFYLIVGSAALVVATAGVGLLWPPSPAGAATTKTFSSVVRGGELSFDFDGRALEELHLSFVSNNDLDGAAEGPQATFAILDSSALNLEADNDALGRLVSGKARISGAFLVHRFGERIVIGSLVLEKDPAGAWVVSSGLTDPGRGRPIFEVKSTAVEAAAPGRGPRLTGELVLTTAGATILGVPEAAGKALGTLRLDAGIAGHEARRIDASSAPATRPETAAPQQRNHICLTATSDVIVAALQSVGRYAREGDIIGFAVGTTACNLGEGRACWIAYNNNHPVIIQDMFRLKDDKFEHIGMSWVKHGFYAVSQSLCGPCNDPTDGSELGAGCSDPYSASLNGVQTNMSPRATVNAYTGYFPYPWSGWTGPPPESGIERRLQVHFADLDPALNEGALFFVQGNYVMAQEARVETHDNNVSYREAHLQECLPGDEVTFKECLPGNEGFKVRPVASAATQRAQPAVRAWQDYDPQVVETDLRVPGEGLFILAAKATDLGTGIWRYSYALYNQNSDRSGRSFSVPLPEGVNLSNVGFHDVDYHSGEPYDLTDWPANLTGDAIVWSTDPWPPGETEDPNSNALRFNTLYNFYFDAAVEPASTNVTLGLYKPGFPAEVQAPTIGPKLAFIDCNGNRIADYCDVECGIAGCGERCGTSTDCNLNSVPDECEPDCNENGAADDCDITFGTSNDCNGNRVPDECETDCNGNGVPDDCEVIPDTDGDGVNDCFDLCPTTTPEDTCVCPEFGDCCFPPELGGQCFGPITWQQCLTYYGAIPYCIEQPCRQGCLIGDYDAGGDLDLRDYGAYQLCVSLDINHPEYNDDPAPQECSIPLDFDEDDDVDREDFRTFVSWFNGPKVDDAGMDSQP